jgi:hypothetical protein
MTRIAPAILLLLTGAASAQPLPVLKVGACPAGYTESGGLRRSFARKCR